MEVRSCLLCSYSRFIAVLNHSRTWHISTKDIGHWRASQLRAPYNHKRASLIGWGLSSPLRTAPIGRNRRPRDTVNISLTETTGRHGRRAVNRNIVNRWLRKPRVTFLCVLPMHCFGISSVIPFRYIFATNCNKIEFDRCCLSCNISPPPSPLCSVLCSFTYVLNRHKGHVYSDTTTLFVAADKISWFIMTTRARCGTVVAGPPCTLTVNMLATCFSVQ